MSINLEKGRSINLEKESGERLTNFCVGCNWGAVVNSTFFGLFKSTIDVDVDLSCLMFNAEGQPIDTFGLRSIVSETTMWDCPMAN